MTKPPTTTPAASPPDPDYGALLDDVSAAIVAAQAEAIRRTNALTVALYWRVGNLILERQRDERYGSRLIDRLSVDLTARFRRAGTWTPRNLWYMRSFAAAWTDEILLARLQNLSWTHHITLLNQVEVPELRRWYLEQAIVHRWSSRMLAIRIAANHHEAVGRAPTNFPMTLPEADGDLLAELATDPHRLDFLALGADAGERDLEAALVDRITEFLTHLGRGFTYAGRQYRLTVGDTDFFLDLLFFNTELNCYVVFELKVRAFTPGDAGQLAFYVTAIERQLRRTHHGPTIGVLLVPGKDDVVVEYALASVARPMAVASFTVQELPADVREVMPAPGELADVLHDIEVPQRDD